MEEFVQKYLNATDVLNIYDIGAMEKSRKGSYKALFDKDKWRYIGVDIAPGPNVDHVVKEMYQWDIENDSADVVISGQCLEHVEYFWETAKEMARILKPNGLMCIILPSQGRIHKHPVDCWRFLPDGMMALAKYTAMEVLRCEIPENADGKWKDVVLFAKKPLKE
jgi:SAM-dependent methyltransferase